MFGAEMYDDEVSELVEKATSDLLFATDWETNLACVDAVLKTDDGPEVVVDVIREKLQSDNENVVVLALEVRAVQKKLRLFAIPPLFYAPNSSLLYGNPYSMSIFSY